MAYSITQELIRTGASNHGRPLGVLFAVFPVTFLAAVLCICCSGASGLRGEVVPAIQTLPGLVEDGSPGGVGAPPGTEMALVPAKDGPGNAVDLSAVCARPLLTGCDSGDEALPGAVLLHNGRLGAEFITTGRTRSGFFSDLSYVSAFSRAVDMVAFFGKPLSAHRACEFVWLHESIDERIVGGNRPRCEVGFCDSVTASAGEPVVILGMEVGVFEQEQVFDTVVGSVFIDMVDNFRFTDVSADCLFGDKNVLKHLVESVASRVVVCDDLDIPLAGTPAALVEVVLFSPVAEGGPASIPVRTTLRGAELSLACGRASALGEIGFSALFTYECWHDRSLHLLDGVLA